MKYSVFILRLGILLAFCQPLVGQHCAPVFESYLNEISIHRSGDKINFQLQYTLEGGHGQEGFQAYALAYLERDAFRVPAPKPSNIIDSEVVLVLNTQLIQKNASGTFDIAFEMNGTDLAKKMIAHRKLGSGDRVLNGSWVAYKDRIRIAIFIPKLEDLEYSVIEGLPEDRHCCTISDVPALLLQELPYRFSFRSAKTTSPDVEATDFIMEVNGDHSPLGNWPQPDEASDSNAEHSSLESSSKVNSIYASRALSGRHSWQQFLQSGIYRATVALLKIHRVYATQLLHRPRMSTEISSAISVPSPI